MFIVIDKMADESRRSRAELPAVKCDLGGKVPSIISLVKRAMSSLRRWNAEQMAEVIDAISKNPRC